MGGGGRLHTRSRALARAVQPFVRFLAVVCVIVDQNIYIYIYRRKKKSDAGSMPRDITLRKFVFEGRFVIVVEEYLAVL